MKIPTADVTDETLAIDDTHEDDVRGGDWVRSVRKVGRHVELIQVMPPVSQSFTNASGATC